MTTDVAVTTRMIAPLRGIASVETTGRTGLNIGPHNMWCDAEFLVTLECGHGFLTSRMCEGALGDYERLYNPIVGRFRCKECDPVPSKGRPKRKTPDPEYDPVIAALVTAACRADSAAESELLVWISQHGRFVADQATRERAYRELVLVLVDRYAPDAHPGKAPAARESIHRWVFDSTEENRSAAGKDVRRLYDAQHGGGQWFANRGVIAAASAMTPAHRIRGILDAITWDAETRAPFYDDLAAKRAVLDATAVVGTDEDIEDARSELDRAMSGNWPTINATHVPVVKQLLSVYARVVAENGRGTTSSSTANV